MSIQLLPAEFVMPSAPKSGKESMYATKEIMQVVTDNPVGTMFSVPVPAKAKVSAKEAARLTMYYIKRDMPGHEVVAVGDQAKGLVFIKISVKPAPAENSENGQG